MANWGLANFRHKPFHGNLLINTVTSDCVFAESTQWVGQLKNNAIEPWKTLNYQTTVQRTFSWDSGWEIKWSAAGLTFLFQVNLDGDEVFKEHIVDVGVILLEEVFEFSRLCIFYKNNNKKTMNQLVILVVFFWNHFSRVVQFKTELLSILWCFKRKRHSGEEFYCANNNWVC